MHIMELTERTDRNGYVRIRVPTSLPKQDVDLVIVVQPAQPTAPEGNPYDFSGLSGRLAWQGNALGEQKALRSEW